MTRLIYVILAVISILPSAWCDIIELKNGNSIEGIITEEDNASISLDLGVGKMKIRKSKIEQITRASEAELKNLQQQWQRNNILHPRHTPSGLESLAKDFQTLEAQHASAINAARKKAALETNITRTQNELTTLYREYLDVSEKIQWMNPQTDTASYNSTVARNNALSSALNLKHADLEQMRKDLAVTEQTMASYLQRLSSYDAEFRQAEADETLRNLSPQHKFFFEELDKRLQPFRHEHKTHNIIISSAAGGTLVPVVIDGLVSATFILDTGASTVTISQALAKRLKLDLSKSTKTRITLANGKSTDAYQVLLTSIEVGSASAKKVEAVVLPDPPADGIDGLLGMSFLNRFRVNLDGSSKHLILEELDLKAK